MVDMERLNAHLNNREIATDNIFDDIFDDIFDENFISETQHIQEYTEEDRQKEQEAWMTVCGSCINFISFHAEAGFCKLSTNKPCEDMRDIWDNKCENWSFNE